MTLPVITPGKARGLSATSSPEGIFKVLAVDHRDSMRVIIDPSNPEGLAPEELTAAKIGLLREMAAESTAVMLDPEYSGAQAIVSRALPGSVGFLVAIEAQGYLGDSSARQTSLLDGWGVEKAKRLGANAIKLLVLYRPDAGETTDIQDQVIRSVVAECARHDIPLFLEPLAYSTEPGVGTDSREFALRRRKIVIDTVKRLGALKPDVLKVQFPIDTRFESDRKVWVDACDELDDAAPVPWALLSGGDPYDLFRDQVRIACSSGASGFLVGRALWGEYVRTHESDKQQVLDEVVRPRFEELSTLASAHGRDWGQRYQMADVDERWYLTY